MLVLQNYSEGYESYIDYLLHYNGGLLLMESYVPFWMRTYLENLDLIESESDAELERIKGFILEEPTYQRLNKLYDTIRIEMIAARGAKFHVDNTPLGRKYQVVLNLLIGLHPAPFDSMEWAVSFACHAVNAFNLDNAKQSELNNRLEAALAKFEPDKP